MQQLELNFLPPKRRAPIFWNICKRCDVHIVRDIDEMRLHLADDHDMWVLLDEDVKYEYKVEQANIAPRKKNMGAREGMFVIGGRHG